MKKRLGTFFFVLGAVLNTAKVEKGSRVAVFGLGAVGLAVIMVRLLLEKKFVLLMRNLGCKTSRCLTNCCC